MYLKNKHPLIKIAKLLSEHERYIERGREFYSKAGQKLDKALELQAPLDEPIPMPDGRRVVIRDQFADSNRAFTSSAVNRYKIEPYRADKLALPTRPKAAKSVVVTAQGVAGAATKRGAPALPKGFVDCTVDFPADDMPVRVLTKQGITGKAAYCSEAGNWYVVKPGHPTHRSLWIDVFGPKSEIVAWAPASGK